jgi:hypothetical protein
MSVDYSRRAQRPDPVLLNLYGRLVQFTMNPHLRLPRERDPWETKMLFFTCPDVDTPVGGIKKIYDHAALLCDAGVSAAVLHTQVGFRCSWFESGAPVVYAGDQEISPSDVIVLPEIFAGQASTIACGLPFAIFNQNAFFTFSGWGIPNGKEDVRADTSYLSRDSMGIVCVSEHNRRYLRRAFPEVDIYRINYGVERLPTYSAIKKNVIAYMPRKNADHVEQVLNILAERDALNGFTLNAIDGSSHEDALMALAEARVFLSFGYPEGFGLPMLEAAASGCLMIGYDGFGGSLDSEVLNESTGFPIAFGDTLGFADEVERVLTSLRADEDVFSEKINLAMATALSNFTLDRERETVVAAWQQVLQNHKVWTCTYAKGVPARTIELPPNPRAAHEDRLTRELLAIAHELKCRDDLVARAAMRIAELDAEVAHAHEAINALESENAALKQPQNPTDR